MMKAMAMLFMVMTAMSACVALRKFDEKKAQFKEEKESVPLWKISEREDDIVNAMEREGHLSIEMVEPRNPVIDWVLGGCMAFGVLLTIVGLLWTAYNLIYLAGQYVKSGILGIVSGMAIYGLGYFLSEHVWILLTAMGVVTVGVCVWLIWYLKNERKKVEAAVRTTELAKNDLFTDCLKDEIRTIQGKHQPLFKKVKRELFGSD